MKYTEINTELDKLREILREHTRQGKEAEEKQKKAPKWQTWELTELFNEILNLIEAINETQHKINKKLKENE